jgi:hypothetical protein
MESRFKIDFMGIGSGKCGSTWLHENLVKHPTLFDGNLKELNYFSDLYDEHPFSWYASQFDGCPEGQLKSEFSVTYLSHPLAAERVKRHFPDVKILAIVRDPVQRTFSNYLHSLRKGDVSPSVPFADYIRDESNLVPARYVDHLTSWYSTFPRENIKVLILEEFTKDLKGTYRDLFSFIGVDPEFLPPGYEERSNEARAYKSLWIENTLVRSYRWLSRRGYTKLVKQILDSGVGEWVRSLNSGPAGAVPRVDEASRGRLKEYYQPLNAQLGQLLEHDLSVWAR